jgi:uncharacterized protein (UPF0303 family)
MNIDEELKRIAVQERLLRFLVFTEATAWEVGTALRARAEALGQAVTIEIRRAGATLFFYAMPGTAPANADWARRKRNLVELTQTSSFATGLTLKRDGTTLEATLGLPLRDYACHGGCFPLLMESCGCIGTITVSGLPQRDDHYLIVEVLAAHLGITLET